MNSRASFWATVGIVGAIMFVLLMALTRSPGSNFRDLATNLTFPTPETGSPETGACFFYQPGLPTDPVPPGTRCIEGTEEQCKNAAGGAPYFFHPGQTCSDVAYATDPGKQCGGKVELVSATGQGIDEDCETAKKNAESSCHRKLMAIKPKHCPAGCQPSLINYQNEVGACFPIDTQLGSGFVAQATCSALYVCGPIRPLSTPPK